MKRALLAVALGVVLVLGVVLYRTARFTTLQVVEPPVAPAAVDTAGAAARLAGALRFRTVSHQDSLESDRAEFARFQDYLRANFPNVHTRLKREVTTGFNLLYQWTGTDTTLQPILLMAHQDVVPVEAAMESLWTQPPFAGRIADGFVWGRGAMDDKSGLLAILEAVERLLVEGVTPRRTVYLAFGHDEEAGGRGAARTASLLAERHVHQLEFVLDEGGAIATGLVPGIAGPVALVSTAEKGYVTVELTVRAEGGHSSMPPAQTAVGILSAAVARLERTPMPRAIRGATADMLDYVGREMTFGSRLAFANRWLFDGMITRRIGTTPSGNATLRTTTAATMFQAGVKENVLPSIARAVINFRILPGDSVGAVLEHVRSAIADARVSVAILPGSVSEPSPVSPPTAGAFQLLARTIRQVAPGTIVTPGLASGATDARRFTELSPNVYRFSALGVRPEDLLRIHGINERVSIKDHARNIAFYVQLLRNTAF